MYLFYVTEPVELVVEPAPDGRRGLVHRPSLAGPGPAADAPRRLRLDPPPGGSLTAGSLHFAFSRPFLETLAAFSRGTGRDVVRLLSRGDQARVLALPRMPVRLGYGAGPGEGRGSLEAQLDAARLEGPARVAVVNPFGYALGDSVVLLTALRELRARLAGRLGAVEIDVLQHTDNLDSEEVYLRSGVVGAVHHLPAPLSLLGGYDAYVDLSAPYPSHGLPWTDEMLELLGIDPAGVPPERKRNAFPVRPEVAREVAEEVAPLKASGAPVLFLHHRASTPIRSLPDAAVRRVVDEVLARTGWTVASALPLPVSHPRVADWSGLSTSFERLACLLSHADALLSVDTSVYHLADAVDTPGVVLFTSIDPDYRRFYYPRLRGVRVGGEASPLAGKSASDDAADLAYAEAVWAELDLPGIIGALEETMAARPGAPAR